MARTRPELIIEQVKPREYNLENNLEDWDVALDYARGPEQIRKIDLTHKIAREYAPDDEFLRRGIVAPILDFVSAHARIDHDPRLRKLLSGENSSEARFFSEVDAVRALYESGAPMRDGKQEAFRKKLLLGTTRIQNQVRNTEPAMDPYLEQVERAISFVHPAEFLWFFWAYVELDPPEVALRELGPVDKDGRKRGGQEKEARTRTRSKDVGPEPLHREGRSAFSLAHAMNEGVASLPSRSQLKAGAAITAQVLIAERAGIITAATPESEYADRAKPVAKCISNVRAALRNMLLGVELDLLPRYVIEPGVGR